MDTKLLTNVLDSNSIEYSIDSNPSPEKISRIQQAILRKKSLIELAVNFYKQVRGVK